MYGFNATAGEYADKALMSPENMILPSDYHAWLCSTGRVPMFGSDELISAASAISEAASITPEIRGEEDISWAVKTKIVSHPSYPRLLQAYIDCQKVGAPPEIASILDEILRENDVNRREIVPTCFGADPELDEFMETYCDMLVKFKSDLSRPFDEATTFLNKIEMQLRNLCTGASIRDPSGETREHCRFPVHMITCEAWEPHKRATTIPFLVINHRSQLSFSSKEPTNGGHQQ
ncbi:hypothetical protein V6N13_102335 [Hibiscus sabdariffa]